MSQNRSNAATAFCDECRHPFPLGELDAKPSSRRFLREEAALGQREALTRAADRGEDFDRLECEECYGPSHVSIGVQG